ncbi:hypothetical protein P22_3401 [Propionispora sp. 2/2-37]|uniref:PHP domain-containing protein n=1 Tax=Propionispora sp. 2/2-37 TaxID=1677858 RepID=UPI0006BB9515|nr:PHP domain-containing protein [Propionispora sp. 2/2-37]CUH97274.1 hypothetical protein P22_3401 [Propionispora sp. 2/2-37]
MMELIDLHTHSHFSDGTLSPRTLIKLAAQSNIRAVALTDHDIIEGIAEARQAAGDYGVEFLPGIEVSARYQDGKMLHILGLGIDIHHPVFLAAYRKMRKHRDASIAGILKYIASQHIYIERDMLMPFIAGQYLDRFAILRYFMHHKLCPEIQQVWDRYMDPVPYGENELWTVEEALAIIRAAGGRSFLAHYTKRIGLAGYTLPEMEAHVRYLKSMGLDGIERYYPSFSRNETEYADYLIEKYQLLPSGGTDFHGLNRKEVQLGIGSGDFAVPYRVYEDIIRE